MKVRIGKEFSWEMSHRLTFHDGLCKNIHGHSYKLLIELFGDTDKNGMLLDYYHIKRIVKPFIEKLDHAFICNKDDKDIIDFLSSHNFKLYIIDDFTTSENMAKYFASLLAPEFAKYSNIDDLIVRVYETEDTYAEVIKKLKS